MLKDTNLLSCVYQTTLTTDQLSFVRCQISQNFYLSYYRRNREKATTESTSIVYFYNMLILEMYLFSLVNSASQFN